jgi:hypothetical protein
MALTLGTCSAILAFAPAPKPIAPPVAAAPPPPTRELTIEEKCDRNLVEGVKHTSDGEVRSACESAMRSRLQAPLTAEFPGIFSGKRPVIADANCDRTWSSWVEAQNLFGVKLHTDYVCTFTASTGLARIEILSQ